VRESAEPKTKREGSAKPHFSASIPSRAATIRILDLSDNSGLFSRELHGLSMPG
jgi:hypothetical protein